ncbi:hypothetical protein [Shimia sediminis]|uniref:hypothetical protein n=1 Tax=Shimia sediminis TaxID=2497945 RepID=UPI000F8DDBC7|nr:hypothetical protein [Shimia sediminis]
MEQQQVHLQLPEPMLRAAAALAKDADISVGQLVRCALEAETKRRTTPAKTPKRADEPLLASLRKLLARDLAVAVSWPDLTTRLADKGFAFREAGGALALHSHPAGTRLCKASELGYGYAALLRRFGKPFPGHSHQKLAERVIGASSACEEVLDPDP